MSWDNSTEDTSIIKARMKANKPICVSLHESRNLSSYPTKSIKVEDFPSVQPIIILPHNHFIEVVINTENNNQKISFNLTLAEATILVAVLAMAAEQAVENSPLLDTESY